jgi:hypothetical protein
MKYLLDTCVISEVIKPQADKNVISWMQSQNEDNLYLSVLTFGVVRKALKSLTMAREKGVCNYG